MYGDMGAVGNVGSCMGIRAGVRKCGVTYGDMGSCGEMRSDV